MKLKTDEANEYFEAKVQLEKEKKNLIIDREKMKDRVKKLKMRRGKYDDQEKVCKNCGKDYIETENFNWSCRTHRSEFSGEIWWCCGKDYIEAPGCKYSKHESKEDHEDTEHDEEFQQKNIKIRCYCCKELGHTIDVCPRDPNIRSKVDSQLDYERIQKIKDYRKLHAETVATTTHFLKKCVIVPNKPNEQEDKTNKANPFKRGSMQFDDFNYEQYNPYILVEEDKAKTRKARKMREFGTDEEIEFVIDGTSNISPPAGLSEEALQDQKLDNYIFGSLSVKTPAGTDYIRNSLDALKSAGNQLELEHRDSSEESAGKKRKIDMAAMARQVLHGVSDGVGVTYQKGGHPQPEENKNEVEFPERQKTQDSEVQRTDEDLDEDSTNQMMLTDEEEQ